MNSVGQKASAPAAPPLKSFGKTKKRLSRIGERGQIVIPKAIRDTLGLAKNTGMEFEVRGREVVMRQEADMEVFDRAVKKWRGALAEEFKKDGFGSTNEFMDMIRDRDPEYKRIMGWDCDNGS